MDEFTVRKRRGYSGKAVFQLANNQIIPKAGSGFGLSVSASEGAPFNRAPYFLPL